MSKVFSSLYYQKNVFSSKFNTFLSIHLLYLLYIPRTWYILMKIPFNKYIQSFPQIYDVKRPNEKMLRHLQFLTVFFSNILGTNNMQLGSYRVNNTAAYLIY